MGLDRVSPMLLPDDTPEGVKRRPIGATLTAEGKNIERIADSTSISLIE